MVQRWYRAIITSSRWIHLDELIYWDPTAGCNGGVVPLLHHSFLLYKIQPQEKCHTQ